MMRNVFFLVNTIKVLKIGNTLLLYKKERLPLHWGQPLYLFYVTNTLFKLLLFVLYRQLLV